MNTSGYRKLSSAYSSCRLFCRGVPVSSSAFWHLRACTAATSEQQAYLSSMVAMHWQCTGLVCMRVTRAAGCCWVQTSKWKLGYTPQACLQWRMQGSQMENLMQYNHG